MENVRELEFCTLIGDSLRKARKVRVGLNEIILEGYTENSKARSKIIREIDDIYRNLLKCVGMTECMEEPLLCLDPIGLNNAVEGCKTVMENLGYIKENQDCSDQVWLYTEANSLFCTYVLGTLSKMKTECYVDTEKMYQIRNNTYVSVKCEGEYSDPVNICRMIEEVYANAVGCATIIGELLWNYDLDEEFNISRSVVAGLRDTYKIIVNETHFIYSQIIRNPSVKCSHPVMEARLMKANRMGEVIGRLLLRYEFEDCDELYMLCIYYEIAEQIAAFLGQVRSGLGCTTCDKEGGK